MYVQKILLTELIRSAAADGAYDIRRCHNELRCKKIRALTHPRKGAGYNWKAKNGDIEPLLTLILDSTIYSRI